MKINIRKISKYKEVSIEDLNTTIKTGILDRQEQNELIEELQNAIDLLKED